MASEESESTELSRREEVADRAGAIVTDHVRSVVDSAQASAADLERDAAAQSDDLRGGANQIAEAALAEIEAASERLRALVTTLREDAGNLSGGSRTSEAAD